MSPLHTYRFIALLVCASALASAAENPPVILISIDTLRADHLSAYGYTRIHTPNIDAFAEHGTIFKAIDSQIPLTLPSHTCLFTSTYPFENGVEENAEIVPANVVTLASVLQAHGYRTAAFLGSDLLAQRYQLDKGFDVYDSPFHPISNAQNPYDVRVRRDAALVVRSATQWLSANSDKPPFAFLHFFDLHAPYGAAAGGGMLPKLFGYDAELEYVNRVMGRLKKTLVDKGLWDRALIIVLSDHGESLGDHGETSHGYFIYQSTLWVPLLIHWPKSAQPLPATVSDAAGLIDVAPTILDFLHIEQPPTFHGTSLLKSAKRSVYSESVYAHDAFRWSPLRSLRVGDSQYIDAPSAELYKLSNDPNQHKNVVQSNPAAANELRTSLRALMVAHPKQAGPVTHDTSAATSSALTSLGYVATTSRSTSSASGPDPKLKLFEYQAYEKGLEALYDNRETEAVNIFKAILLYDANSTIVRYYLGEAYVRLQQPDDALREFKAALAQDPSYAAAAEAIQQLTKR